MTNRVNRSVRRRRKVYRWTAASTIAIRDALGDPPWHAQHYAIVCAASRTEVAQLARVNRASQLLDLGRTYNKANVEATRSRPGVIFVRSINNPGPLVPRENISEP